MDDTERRLIEALHAEAESVVPRGRSWNGGHSRPARRGASTWLTVAAAVVLIVVGITFAGQRSAGNRDATASPSLPPAPSASTAGTGEACNGGWTGAGTSVIAGGKQTVPSGTMASIRFAGGSPEKATLCVVVFAVDNTTLASGFADFGASQLGYLTTISGKQTYLVGAFGPGVKSMIFTSRQPSWSVTIDASSHGVSELSTGWHGYVVLSPVQTGEIGAVATGADGRPVDSEQLNFGSGTAPPPTTRSEGANPDVSMVEGWASAQNVSTKDAETYWRDGSGHVTDLGPGVAVHAAAGSPPGAPTLVFDTMSSPLSFSTLADPLARVVLARSVDAWVVGGLTYYQTGLNTLTAVSGGKTQKFALPSLPAQENAFTFDGGAKKGVFIRGAVEVQAVLRAPNGHVVAVLNDTNSAGLLDLTTGRLAPFSGFGTIETTYAVAGGHIYLAGFDGSSSKATVHLLIFDGQSLALQRTFDTGVAPASSFVSPLRSVGLHVNGEMVILSLTISPPDKPDSPQTSLLWSAQDESVTELPSPPDNSSLDVASAGPGHLYFYGGPGRNFVTDFDISTGLSTPVAELESPAGSTITYLAPATTN